MITELFHIRMGAAYDRRHPFLDGMLTYMLWVGIVGVMFILV